MGLHARRPLLDLCFFHYNIKKLEKIIYKIPSVVGWIIAPQRYPCPNPQEITKSSNSWLWSPRHGWVWSRQNRIGGEQCKINTGPVTTAQAWGHLHRASWSLESFSDHMEQLPLPGEMLRPWQGVTWQGVTGLRGSGPPLKGHILYPVNGGSPHIKPHWRWAHSPKLQNT